MKWTTEDDAALIEAVTKAASVPAAIDAARIALPHRALNGDSIGKRLMRLGKPPLSELIKRVAASAPPERPRVEVISHLDEHRNPWRVTSWRRRPR
jgi:hypothetical protein